MTFLLRHGATPLTADRRYSGSGGSDPDLIDIGRAQARPRGGISRTSV